MRVETRGRIYDRMNRRRVPALALLAATLVLGFTPRATAAQGLAIQGEIIHTLAGAPIATGVVLVRDGKIERIGPASEIAIPAGYRSMRAAVLTPGLIDARSVVGLAGQYNVDHDQDQLDMSSPIQPDLRAIDAYNAREALVAVLRGMGVTTLHTGHGPGALVSGQTMIVKTAGDTVEHAVVRPEAMLAFTLGPEVGANFDNKPGTRAKGVAMLRSEFIKAQEYARKRNASGSTPASTTTPARGRASQPAANETKAPDRDLRLEALARVLAKEMPALVTAQRATEILAALRLQREFGFDLVLDGAAEAYLVLDEIAAAKVPVFLHPTMARLAGATQNATLETASLLQRRGIPFAIQSGFEGYVPKTRVVLFEAAVAAANGLTFEEALASVTRSPAQLLGIADRVGTLEAGKDADVVLFDGDPFEYTTHVCGVVIGGNVVSEVCL